MDVDCEAAAAFDDDGLVVWAARGSESFTAALGQNLLD